MVLYPKKCFRVVGIQTILYPHWVLTDEPVEMVPYPKDDFAELYVYTNKPTHHYNFSLLSRFFQAIERSQ